MQKDRQHTRPSSYRFLGYFYEPFPIAWVGISRRMGRIHILCLIRLLDGI